MQNFIIETDESGRELIDHGDSFFPLAGYDEYFSDFVLKEVPWHWHEEVELVIVIDGSTKVEYLDGYTELNKGEGIFINSNILHRMTQIGSINCHIINFVFKPEFLGGRYDSRIFTKFINPICSNTALSIIHFIPSIKWERDFISKVTAAFHAYSLSELGYEMAVRAILTDAWRLLCVNHPTLFKNIDSLTENKKRINKIIRYIHSNYDHKLTVQNIALVADISESECFRLFQKVLHTTPNAYILNHRLQLSAIKLVESDASILNLAYDLGFGSPSYFSKKFKEHYSCTPREFRRIHQTK